MGVLTIPFLFLTLLMSLVVPMPYSYLNDFAGFAIAERIV